MANSPSGTARSSSSDIAKRQVWLVACPGIRSPGQARRRRLSMGFGSPRHMCLCLLAGVLALLLAPSALAQDGLVAPAVAAAPAPVAEAPAPAPAEVAAPVVEVASTAADAAVAQVAVAESAAPAAPAPAPPAPKVSPTVESAVATAKNAVAATAETVRAVVETAVPATRVARPVAAAPRREIPASPARRAVRTPVRPAKAKKRATTPRKTHTAARAARPTASFQPSTSPRRATMLKAPALIDSPLGTTTAWAPDPDRADRAAASARPFPPAPSLPSAPDGLAASWLSAPGAAATGAGAALLFALLLAVFAFSPPGLSRLMSLVRAGPDSSPFSLLLERPG
jgi:hypothetical protein